MPKGGPRLSGEQVDAIRRWIESAGPAATASGPAQSQGGRKVSEREVVMTILGAKCFVCHGRSLQQSGLDLRTRAAMLKGGKSGPAIVPGKAEDSLVVQKIASHQMPPPKLQEQYSVRELTSDELDKLKQWIADGALADSEKAALVDPANDPLVRAEDRQFWSFRQPVRPPVPPVQAAALFRNPIDAFLLQKLETKGLTFSPEAGKLALLRRVSLDLTGLPPSPDEIKKYIADDRADAYDRLVERLLASPRYGERWARYWLDSAGYADSEGAVSADSIRAHAWRYRDYVIARSTPTNGTTVFCWSRLRAMSCSTIRQLRTIRLSRSMIWWPPASYAVRRIPRTVPSRTSCPSDLMLSPMRSRYCRALFWASRWVAPAATITNSIQSHSAIIIG